MMNSYVYLLNRNEQQAAQWNEIPFEPKRFWALNQKIMGIKPKFENSSSFFFIMIRPTKAES